MRNHKKTGQRALQGSRRVILAVWTSMALCPWLSATWAQYTAQLAERESKPILEYFLTIGFTTVCVAIAAMNPKRSHQA